MTRIVRLSQTEFEKKTSLLTAKMTSIMTITPESEDLMYEFYLELIKAIN